MAVLLATATLTANAAQPFKPGDTYEGLQRVERRGLDSVYIRPGATLAQYRHVMMDPVEVSFDKNWDPKGGRPGFDRADPQRIRKDLAEIARDVFRDELEKRGGYTLVTEPGADVLRVKPRIVDLYINAPETDTPGIVRTYVVETGEMTLVADLVDSTTNTLIAHVKDRERDNGISGRFEIANRVTNAAEARRVIGAWARQLRKALDAAKSGEGAERAPQR
jgi:hypothetical protein